MQKVNNDGALTKLSFDEVSDKLGQVVGKSEWYSINQAMIDSFADLTKDPVSYTHLTLPTIVRV